MRTTKYLSIGVLVASAAVTANAQTNREFGRREIGHASVPYGKPQTDAKVLRFGNLTTGELYDASAVSVIRDHIEWGFNSLDGNPDILPPGYPNYSWGDASGAMICDFNDPNDFVYLSIDPISASTCGDPNDFDLAIFAFGVTCASWDIRFDNYFCDAALWGGDPNGTRAPDQIGLVLGKSGVLSPPGATRIVFGFFERFDRNGDGNFCAADGGPYYVDLLLTGSAQWLLTINVTGLPAIPGAGFFMIDVANQMVDPNTGAYDGREACGYYLAVAGGVAYEEANCPTPTDMLTAGSSFDPYIQSDWYIWSTGWGDANCLPVDPNSGCDPNFAGTTYGDIWNAGLGLWVQYTDDVTGRGLAMGFCWRVGVLEPDSCVGDIGGAGGCGVPDGAVDLTDLGCLLGDYGLGGVGDIGGGGGCGVPDGATDLTDLGCLLGAYGPCP